MTESTESTDSASRVELTIAFTALALMNLVQMIGTRTTDLLSHPLWLDEVLTSVQANDPSFSHMLAAIRGGVETNPPTMYLLLWPIAKLFGPLGNTALRLLPMLCMLAALTMLYAIVRRFFPRGPSIVGLLVVAAHPLVISLTYEARFYALWLMLTIAYCLAMLRNDERATTSRSIAMFVLAILVSTVHWFGIIGLALITAGDLFVRRQPKRVLPLMVGALSVACCLPFYFGQRQGMTVKTWIDPINPSDLRDGLIGLFGAPSFVFCVIGSVLIGIFVLQSKSETTPGLKPMGFSPGVVSLCPLCTLITFPFVIIVFSIVVQPSFVQRYLVLAIAPLAAIAAYLAKDLNKYAIGLMIVAIFGIGSAELISKSHATRGLDAGFNDTVAAINARTRADDLIVFKRRREMYPVLQLEPKLSARVAQLDFEGVESDQITAATRYERDIGKKVARFYPRYSQIDVNKLRRQGAAFYMVVPEEELGEARAILPDFDIEPSDDMLHRVKH